MTSFRPMAQITIAEFGIAQSADRTGSQNRPTALTYALSPAHRIILINLGSYRITFV